MAGTFIGTSNGAHVVQESDLQYIATPPATYSWKPVSHSDMVQRLKRTLVSQGIEIVRESYSVAAEGLNLFGVFDVAGNPNIGMPAGFSLGFRHSNKKQFAIQMVAGLRVFVCSNLCFSGDMITLKRKHTSGLDLGMELSRGVSRYVVKSQNLQQQILVMANTGIDDNGAKSFILDSVVQGVMPQALLVNSYENYFEHPEYEDCAPRTVWGLNNALTRAIRDANLVDTSKFSATIALGTAIAKLIR